MKSFHNDPLIKEKYINRLKDHYSADEIIKGQYWENGKGCAVGCTIHSRNHSNYETELGIPKVIARLEDNIFEKLPNELAKEFPLQFLSAINVGADLSNVWRYFTIWLLTDAEYGMLQFAKNKKVVQDIADAYLEDITMPVTVERWKELRKVASANAYSGADADAVADAAFYAAVYAADAAVYAAAVYAANAATVLAAAAVLADYAAADYGSKEQWYTAASQKLIELLKQQN